MKKRRRNTFKRSRKVRRPLGNDGRMVKRLAAEGLSGDVIAARLGVNMNTLRAQHALHLKAGRDAKAKEKAEAEAAELSKSEWARLAAIKQSFDSPWFKDGRNIIFGNARTVEEALEWCERTNGGCKWITVGLKNV